MSLVLSSPCLCWERAIKPSILSSRHFIRDSVENISMQLLYVFKNGSLFLSYGEDIEWWGMNINISTMGIRIATNLFHKDVDTNKL